MNLLVPDDEAEDAVKESAALAKQLRSHREQVDAMISATRAVLESSLELIAAARGLLEGPLGLPAVSPTGDEASLPAPQNHLGAVTTTAGDGWPEEEPRGSFDTWGKYSPPVGAVGRGAGR